MEGRELDGGRVRAAEAQRREERRGRAHGDAATNSRLVNDVIPQGKTRFAATITGRTTHNDDDEYRRVAARALLATLQAEEETRKSDKPNFFRRRVKATKLDNPAPMPLSIIEKHFVRH